MVITLSADPDHFLHPCNSVHLDYKANFVENIDETDTMEVLHKDKTTLEREEEEKADMEKHAAIIGSISLILICRYYE
ncbi:hypothetical protein ACTXT7_012919 [Hymenolepis weldensis]